MRRLLPAALIVILLAGVVGLIVLTVQQGEEGKELAKEKQDSDRIEAAEARFEFDSIDFEATHQSLEALLEGTTLTPDDPLVAAVLAERRAMGIGNRLGLGHVDPWALSQQEARFQQAAGDLISRDGPAGYAYAGRQAFAQFRGALETAARVQAGPRPDVTGIRAEHAATVLTAAVWTDARNQLAWLGDFAQVARAERLLDEHGRIAAGSQPLVELLFRVQWVRLVGDALTADMMLTAEERVAFRRWQIEMSAAPLEQKLRFVENLRGGIENYDLDRAAAILHYRAGDLPQASRSLRAALENARQNGDIAAIESLEAMLAAVESPPER